ncbi:MAG: VOC family protein [Bacteroidota bacterium]
MAKKAPKSIPPGMRTLTPHMWFNGNCKEAIAFYQQAFDATLKDAHIEDPNHRRVMHAMLQIGDSHVMLADTVPGNWEQGPTSGATTGFWMYVDDVDKIFGRAKKAGCKVLMEVEDAYWGDRVGKLKDPYGHTWAIASQRWIYTDDEIEQNEQEWGSSFEEEG